MEDNKINQTKKEIEKAVKAVKKAKSGNVLGAAKELLKDGKWKKKLKKRLISCAIIISMPVIILMSISNTLADKMGQLLTYISTSVAGLWQWMTDDYWIDLDQKIKYIVDEKTGKVLGTKNGAKQVKWNPWTGIIHLPSESEEDTEDLERNQNRRIDTSG